MPPYLRAYSSITEGIIIFDVQLMVALGAIVPHESYRILDAEVTEGNRDLCLRLQTCWAMTILVSHPNPGYNHDTVGQLIGNNYIYRGTDEYGDPIILFTHSNIWRDDVRLLHVTCYEHVVIYIPLNNRHLYFSDGYYRPLRHRYGCPSRRINTWKTVPDSVYREIQDCRWGRDPD